VGRAINISMLGDRELQRMLDKLPDKVQRKIVRKAMKDSAERLRPEIIRRLSGDPVGVDTGTLRDAFRTVQVKSHGKADLIRFGFPFPTRDALDIAPEDKWFYPSAIEYGYIHGKSGEYVPPRPFMRTAVDDNYDREIRLIGKFVGQGVTREAARLARKK